MIQEFENRLATVIGDQLDAPFSDRVFVSGLEPQDTGARITLGAIGHEPWFPDFGSAKSDRVPGQQDFRRVLRLIVTVVFQITAAQNEGRPQRRSGCDALLFLLEDPSIVDGSDLETELDQGFFIEDLKIADAALPLVDQPNQPTQVTLKARGWFWPAGQPGQAGIAIEATHIRASNMDVQLLPSKPEILAGGPTVNLQLHIRHTGFLLQEDQPPQALGLDFLALDLRAAGGGPGLGGLQGDAQGVESLILVVVDNVGLASFSYTPPAQPGEDILLVSVAKGGLAPTDKNAGKVLAKLSLLIGTP